MTSEWISWQLGGVALIEASAVGYFFLSFFSPLWGFHREICVCFLASVGALLVVWSCSTKMSADLCYSRGIRESVRHQKTRLLDSFPPEHLSSFHSSSYRTHHSGRGFPSFRSKRVTERTSCNIGFSCVSFFFPIQRHKPNSGKGFNFRKMHRRSCSSVWWWN